MLLKEKLKDLDIQISEFSDYLNLSRPTVYKLIELYDSKQFNKIDKNILKLFNYIYENPLIGKKNVINYILKNLANIDDNFININPKIKEIHQFLKDNDQSKKIDFMFYISKDSDFDEIVFFLNEIKNIKNKNKLSIIDKKKLSIFENIKEQIRILRSE